MTIYPSVYAQREKERLSAELQSQASADAQKHADRSAPGGGLVNLRMHTIVDQQDTFEKLANELFGFSRSEQ